MKQSRAKQTRTTEAKRLSAPKPRPSRFARSLLREWQRLDLPETKAAVVVAVSGGADSVALLLGFDELVRSAKLKLEVRIGHLNHRLRGKSSDADALWVKAIGKKLGYKVSAGSVDVKRRAVRTADNLEQAARRARYEFLTKLTKTARASFIVTAHTLDDQAETVLLNLLRGSGAAGLGGIEPARSMNGGGKTLLVRPLLSWARRQDTEAYCRLRGVEFRADCMNIDEKFARVRVRRQLLPLMESFNPKVVEGLARTAELLRTDSHALGLGAERLLELSMNSDSGLGGAKQAGGELHWDLLLTAPIALRRRALRLWLSHCRGDLKRIELVHVVALEKLILGGRGGRVIELPGGGRVLRSRDLLRYIGPSRLAKDA